MQVQDDVGDRLELLAGDDGDTARSIEQRIELTSREPSAEIPGTSNAWRSAPRRRGARRHPRHEHDLGRRRHRPARADGRHGTAAVDVRVHPGDQPRRAPLPRARRRALQRGAVARPLALRVVQGLPLGALPAGRVDERHAVLAARARPRAARGARRARAADRARLRATTRARPTSRRTSRPSRSSRSGSSSVSEQSVSRTSSTATSAQLDEIVELWRRQGRGQRRSSCSASRSNSSKPCSVDAAKGAMEDGNLPTLWSLRDVDLESNLFLVN